MSKLRTFKKEKWGDRADGRWIKGAGLQTIMGHLMPNRTDAEVFMKDSFDVTELLPYLDADPELSRDRFYPNVLRAQEIRAGRKAFADQIFSKLTEEEKKTLSDILDKLMA